MARTIGWVSLAMGIAAAGCTPPQNASQWARAAAETQVKPATAAMKALTILVTSRPPPLHGAACAEQSVCPSLCAQRDSGEDQVCVDSATSETFASALATLLGRAGFRVVRDRKEPYDVELVGTTHVNAYGAGSRHDEYVSPSGVAPWPRDNKWPRDAIAIYGYLVTFGSPQVTQGLRKNDSGGWAQRHAGDPRLPQLEAAAQGLGACMPGGRRLVGRTLREGLDDTVAAQHVVNELATCDALETFAVALGGTPPSNTTAVARATAPAPESTTQEPFRWPDIGTPTQVLAEGTNDSAVVVAIDKYTYLPQVTGAVANGADWVKFLVDGRKVPMERIQFFKDATATREKILHAAARASKEVKPGGTLWFVFIGHGAASHDRADGVLVGGDAQQDPESIDARSVTQQELVRALSKDNSESKVVLLDACFSGRTSSGQPIAPGLQPVLRVAEATAAPNVTLMSAGAADQFAGPLPRGDRPAFSYLTLGALRGWAETTNGEVNAQDAVSYARKVLALTPIGRAQEPRMIGPAIVLSRQARERSPDLRRLMIGQ